MRAWPGRVTGTRLLYLNMENRSPRRGREKTQGSQSCGFYITYNLFKESDLHWLAQPVGRLGEERSGRIRGCINDSQCVIRKLLGLKKTLEPSLSFVSRRIGTAHSPGLREQFFHTSSEDSGAASALRAICRRRRGRGGPAGLPGAFAGRQGSGAAPPCGPRSLPAPRPPAARSPARVPAGARRPGPLHGEQGRSYPKARRE